jgi:Flp pilus assembly protein TadG
MHARIRRIRIRLRSKRLQFRRFRRDERGIQLVEAAIVLPVFLLLFGATAEFGRYFYEYTTLAKAARVGSRYLITAQVKPAEDVTAKNIVVFGNPAGTGSPILTGLSATNIVITRQGGTSVLPELVKVEVVGYKHQPIFDLGLLTKTPTLSMNIDVKPSVTMRYLLTQPPPIE